MSIGFKIAKKHNYIPWNDNEFDKPEKVKVIAEINYLNGHKSYLITHFEHNPKKYEISESYIEFEKGENE